VWVHPGPQAISAPLPSVLWPILKHDFEGFRSHRTPSLRSMWVKCMLEMLRGPKWKGRDVWWSKPFRYFRGCQVMGLEEGRRMVEGTCTMWSDEGFETGRHWRKEPGCMGLEGDCVSQASLQFCPRLPLRLQLWRGRWTRNCLRIRSEWCVFDYTVVVMLFTGFFSSFCA